MAESEKSVTCVIAMVMIVIAVAGWGFLASSYAGAHSRKMSEMSTEELEAGLDNMPGGARSARRAAKGRFIGTAIQQLPNMPAVILWHFSNRVWLPIVIVVLEILAFIAGIKMKALEAELRS